MAAQALQAGAALVVGWINVLPVSLPLDFEYPAELVRCRRGYVHGFRFCGIHCYLSCDQFQSASPPPTVTVWPLP